MIEIYGRNLEEDIVRSGLVAAYGSHTEGLRALRFSDRQEGYFAANGGLFGDGHVSVTDALASNCIFRMPDSEIIRYEKVARGTMGIDHGTDSFDACSGAAVIVGPGAVSLRMQTTSHRMRGIATTISTERLDQFLLQGNERRIGPVEFTLIEKSGAKGPDGPLISLTEHASAHLDYYSLETSEQQRRLLEALIVETFVQLLLATNAVKLCPERIEGSAKVVRRAQEFVCQNLGAPLTISDIAREAEASIRYLQLSFKQILGCTPRAFLAAQRLEAAREMFLARPFSTVTEIAGECGIAHLSRFAHEYRRRYGELPSATLRRSQAGRRETSGRKPN
ncbi:helix-turn-helix transcriptional regulator [Sedimentitalea sp. JM2-8]|uniref:Helix-turn-helix transcriptional regulator n=1 Tax=Sedimentitalea xiamensis TaxID=3050037 RepID=A0ABT7FH44_9RHOB|nr:helix-turn-helix transcriptional regulator [Sedimentitalea xiamensis]MDK3074451.1 helix-turn-helix transcriptional regulator [Sedimentitalea xiamensis]